MQPRWTVGIAALALGLTLSAGWSGADDPAKELLEAGKPGPEHAKLQPLVGTWTYTCRLWMEPGKPPVETNGAIERHWTLGGRFLKEEFAGTGFDGKPGFEGFGLLGYDNAQRRYTATWVCNMGTGTHTGLGVSESPGRFTFQTSCFCPVKKKTVQGREEIRIEADRVVSETYGIEDGKETKVMEIVSVRKK